MNHAARILFLAVVLSVPTLSVAAEKTKDPYVKTSSFAPRPTSGPHVYGAPLGAPLVGPTRGSPAVTADNRPVTRVVKHDQKAPRSGDRLRKSAAQPPKRNARET